MLEEQLVNYTKKMKHPSNMVYTDLESHHIDELIHNMKKKHSAPKINNIYPIYKDMVQDLHRTNHVNSMHHKKTVAIGALKRMFTSKDEIINAKNTQIIEHHAQTITHLLHDRHLLNTSHTSCDETTLYKGRSEAYTTARTSSPCSCKSSCVIL